VIRGEDLVRFCATTSQIAGGDIRAQLEAWNIDHDEFFAFATQWANAAGARHGSDPRSCLVAFFAGFELGYRSCAEAGGLDGDIPDSPLGL
jgi:2-phospho-L-lactate transferase/gluconeogenesis factor (CofD/UPF0052 family)